MYNYVMKLYRLDHKLIHFFRKISVPMARFSLFIVFFWFGALKLLGLSPAGAMVHSLFDQTIHFMKFPIFYIIFALFECLIGILFLIKGTERIVFPLLLIHMITTAMPLFLLTDVTWQSFMVPTLEGQYIIKNLVIIATAIGLVAHLHPLPKKNIA
jgi:uncharacterized membrane protein YkgB